MKTITKYVLMNTITNEPLYESESYVFLTKVMKKFVKDSTKDYVKIYKKIITEEISEMD